jgi:deazaflavin-dependent oxidoreductase (nitroreductase family)
VKWETACQLLSGVPKCGVKNVKFWIFNRFINPIVKAVLRSRIHRLLSGSLVLLTYTGRRSGRHYTLPVMYAEKESDIIIFAGQPQEKSWWRNLLTAAPVEVMLRGRRLKGTGQAIINDEIASGIAWNTYLSKFPKADSARKHGQEPVFVRIRSDTSIAASRAAQ